MKRGILAFFRFYRKFISPLKPPTCRFYPTCSAYGVEAVQKHGAARGLFLTAVRLVKCGPWHPGGYDPVPDRLHTHPDAHTKEGNSACCVNNHD
ncbi:membrane protein insertion efficiency factor YidD [Tumebacillus flagellatus]|uniref:membrane protein insertion efficiency factor YidD n=1 Tax=Tumebacillus flagellatus TaxID=1157490 RepID=UPI0009DD47C6|nr:membrane protein insertion efficiency factor YidD [Tumebacillus flagellatus]